MINKICDSLSLVCSGLNNWPQALPAIGIVATVAYIAKKCIKDRQSNMHMETLRKRATQNPPSSLWKKITVTTIIALATFALFPALRQVVYAPTDLQPDSSLFNRGANSQLNYNSQEPNTLLQQSEKIHDIITTKAKPLRVEQPIIQSYGDFTDEATMEKMKCKVAEFPEGKIIYANKLASIVEKSFQSEAARSLLIKVLKAGPLYIIPGDHRTSPQGGSWRAGERIISLLNSENSKRKLGHLLFEATNALRVKEQLKLRDEAFLGSVSKNSYVERWERIEYEVAKDFTSTIRACINEDKWSEETHLGIPTFVSLASNWDQYWELISKTSHPGQFRNDWDYLYKEKYCKKHPKAADCNS